MEAPLIYDITKASFNDGPGIRTVVFFKGCPLRCIWCHNPESMNPNYEFFWDQTLCINCGNHDKGKSCFTLARKGIGREYKVNDLVKVILEDKKYYESSSGGVTFSGGEPTLHMIYLSEVCRKLKEAGVHITIQTCGYFDYEKFRELLLPYIDLIYFDIKLIQNDEHKKYTGKGNSLIHQNFLSLLNEGIKVVPRTPLIEGITATEENLSGMVSFFCKNNIKECEFLPYNPSGIDKWAKLGKSKPHSIPEKALTYNDQRKWIDFYKDKMKSGNFN